MKYYMAPMEGLTGYVYRNAYHKFFSPMDRYFAPFIANKKMSSRERNDILPDHNQGLCLIPQILTNRSADFLAVAKELKNYGYDIINLNVGCPSGTVVAKGRGAGLLEDPETLDRFLWKMRRSGRLFWQSMRNTHWRNSSSIPECAGIFIRESRGSMPFLMRWKRAGIGFAIMGTSARQRIYKIGRSVSRTWIASCWDGDFCVILF